MKNALFLSLIFAAIMLIGCKKTKDEPTSKSEKLSQYVTDEQKRKMLNSLESLDGERLYIMNYTVDYKLDEVMAAAPASSDSLFSVLSRMLFDVQPKTPYSLPLDYGCSAYAATLKGTDNYLMGRNYDFCHMEEHGEAPATALVLFTAPKNGKKSINFVDAYWLQLGYGFYANDSADISNLMFAPYMITDGMNEDGLAISVLHLEGQPADQKVAGKPDIYASIAMRAILDKFSTVDEAANFLKGYNMHMETPAKGSLHFMLADAQGKYAVVEYSFADPGHVDSTTVPTELYVLQADSNRYVTNFYVDPRLGNCVYGGLSNHGRDRYNTLRDTLQAYDHQLTLSQSKTLLQAVSQNPNPDVPTSHTQWSNLYNLTNRTVEMSILQEYGRWFGFTVTRKK